jgi:hypothetical protein
MKGCRLCIYCDAFNAPSDTTNAGHAGQSVNAYRLMDERDLFKSIDANTTELGNTLAAIRACQFDASLDELNEVLNETLDERQQINAELGRRQKARK